METLNTLINQDRKEYLCFELLKKHYQDNPNFKEIIDTGLKEGTVSGFGEDLWLAIDNQNIRGLKSFEDVFREGYNIDGSTVISRQLSYSFPSCTLCSGLLPMLEGQHCWMTSEGKIYDTSLMLVIDRKYANKLGYQYEIEYNPHEDPIYTAVYEFTNDSELKSSKRR